MIEKFDTKSLEFERLMEDMAGYCFTQGGKSISRSLKPLCRTEDIRASLGFFKQCMGFYPEISRRLDFDLPESLGFISKISYECILEPDEFIAILSVIKVSKNLKSLLKKTTENRLELLARFFYELDELSSLEASIKKVFEDTGRIRDDASGLLKSLRREKTAVETDIKDRLARFMNEVSGRDILQDNYITSRNDRYVIPVKSSFFKLYKGIVQDKSSSGLTSFVEPDFIVPSNNRKKEIEIEEKNEILRILKELSSRVRLSSMKILGNMDIIHYLDFAFGLSAAGIKHGYYVPSVSDEPYISLKNARHPGLVFIKGIDDTIPIDIDINTDNNIVVITGPNTGGKTASLKTVGLICLMVNCGLPIPASPESVIPRLDYIMCDIGDEQNLSQNLSTFSSHITRISSFLDYAGNRSLVLIDEIGAGTDPREGSALGISILEYLRKKKALTLTTTHYGTIKAFAHQRTGYMTAMVEFDKDTLKPTYRLISGEVGKSNAIYIAGKIGLKKEIIDMASRYQGDNEREIERLLNSIEEKDRLLALRLSEIEEERKAFHEQQKKQRNILKDRLQVMIELEKRRLGEIDELMGKLKNLQARKKRVKKPGTPAPLPEIRLKEIEHRVQEMSVEIDERARDLVPRNEEITQCLEPDIGSYVNIRSFSGDFQVKSIDKKSDEYEVVLNNLRMKVGRGDIERVIPGDATGSRRVSDPYIEHFASRTVSIELNIIGLDVDSALQKLENLIDDAYSAGKPYIKIVHGLGEGILREAIREYLETRREVKEIIKGETAYKNSGITEAVFY